MLIFYFLLIATGSSSRRIHSSTPQCELKISQQVTLLSYIICGIEDLENRRVHVPNGAVTWKEEESHPMVFFLIRRKLM
jgi:hypothetical protein